MDSRSLGARFVSALRQLPNEWVKQAHADLLSDDFVDQCAGSGCCHVVLASEYNSHAGLLSHEAAESLRGDVGG